MGTHTRGLGTGRDLRRWTGAGVLVAVLAVTSTACGDGGSAPTTDASDAAAVAAPADAASTSPRPAAAPPEAASSTPAPVITSRVTRRSTGIPFGTRVIKSDALRKGVMQVQQAGRAGVRVKIYRVSLRDGVVVGRRLIRTTVTRRPVPRVTVQGTHVDPPKPPEPEPQSGCDPNYAGACVPIASDVDCGGGSGNGPAYVDGVVEVVGADIYDLDRDGDGTGCD